MGIKDRPYAGNWDYGKQTVVKHTPDARVLINGTPEFAVCATCTKKLDFNKYITSITTDPSTDPISSASISLNIPRHHADVFSYDGNYVLQPGLEVVIQMRGYFPVTGYALLGQETESSDAGGDEVPVYPYYQVFRGVVTEVSHEFSGGFYSAQLSCSSLLHFWQYLYLNTNGSVFGSRPPDSGQGISLVGHRFTGLSPYGIMYTLMRVGFGAAFGANWTVDQKSNIESVDTQSGQSYYKHAALWWEKRWQESSTRFRMYGFDGGLFNAYEQSYLGLFDTDIQKNKLDSYLKSYGIKRNSDRNFFNSAARQAAARAVGYGGYETVSQAAGTDGTTLDGRKMQAYTLDLGNFGQVNMFETQYMSKMEIANAVTEITGYEFYQDVDGDIVFKPPFYNLDTSEDEVYRISDRELISISESEREPEATYVKGGGSIYQNFTGVVSGEFGTKEGKFVDWRLVAKFGWKEASFDSQYYANSKQMFIGAITRLDTANIEMRSATITIPLRPELRPGYPVYVEHLDCFYYVKSISHSFAPGGGCQSSLTCVAKRAKFLPPGQPDREGGKLPSLDDVRLKSPGIYPPMPLYAYSEDFAPESIGAGSADEPSGPPRIIGYPNVVLALDPTQMNKNAIPLPVGLAFDSAEYLLDTALALGALFRTDQPEVYRVATDEDNSVTITKGQIVTAFENYGEILEGIKDGGGLVKPDGTLNLGETDSFSLDTRESAGLSSVGASLAEDFGALLVSVNRLLRDNIEDSESLSNWLALQRSQSQVFGSLGPNAGVFRFYSSSSPDIEDQAPSEITIDAETGERESVNPDSPQSILGEISVLRQSGDSIKVESGLPDRGFRVYGLAASKDSENLPYNDITTRDIRFINFTRYFTRTGVSFTTEGIDEVQEMLFQPDGGIADAIAFELLSYASQQDYTSPDLVVSEVFGEDEKEDGYGGMLAALDAYADALGVVSVTEVTTARPIGFSYVPSTEEAEAGKRGAFQPYITSSRLVGTGDFRLIRVGDAEFFALGDEDRERILRPRGETFPIVQYQQLYVEVTRRVPGRSRPVDGSVKEVTGKSPERGIGGLSGRVAGQSLTPYLMAIQVAWVNSLVAASRGTPTEAEVSARLTFLESFADFAGGQPGGTAKIYAPDKSYKKTGHSSVVLPVSDNAGYEVYGTMAYGRGLTIQSYKKLLEDVGSPTTNESAFVVEQDFANLVAAGGDIAKAIQEYSNDPEEQAEFASRLATNLGGEVTTVDGVTSIKFNADSEKVFVRNTPITSRSRGMSNTEEVSISELTNLTADPSTICLCKGVEANHYIQAFSDSNFLRVSGDEALNDWLGGQYADQSDQYVLTKKALAGETLDTRPGNMLKQTIRDVRKYGESIGRRASDSGREIEEAAERVRRTAEDIGPDEENS